MDRKVMFADYYAGTLGNSFGAMYLFNATLLMFGWSTTGESALFEQKAKKQTIR